MTIPSVTDDLLREIEAAAKHMQGWPNDAAGVSAGGHCVGTIDEEGNFYPVVEIRTEYYDLPSHAEHMADYYAEVNPATVLALITRIRELEKDAARYRKALTFYADPVRYNGANQRLNGPDEFSLDGAAYIQDVTRDGGRIAIKAMQAPK